MELESLQPTPESWPESTLLTPKLRQRVASDASLTHWATGKSRKLNRKRHRYRPAVCSDAKGLGIRRLGRIFDGRFIVPLI